MWLQPEKPKIVKSVPRLHEAIQSLSFHQISELGNYFSSFSVSSHHHILLFEKKCSYLEFLFSQLIHNKILGGISPSQHKTHKKGFDFITSGISTIFTCFYFTLEAEGVTMQLIKEDERRSSELFGSILWRYIHNVPFRSANIVSSSKITVHTIFSANLKSTSHRGPTGRVGLCRKRQRRFLCSWVL